MCLSRPPAAPDTGYSIGRKWISLVGLLDNNLDRPLSTPPVLPAPVVLLVLYDTGSLRRSSLLERTLAGAMRALRLSQCRYRSALLLLPQT